MKANRLAGHTLPNEGRLPGWPPSTQNGTGKARCSCGSESPELPSTTQRQAWFRDHKDDIRAGGNGTVWTGVA
jgi:hypothetical protein